MMKEFDIKTLIFSPAGEEDSEEILALYQSHIGKEFCAWTEDYPSKETIAFDLSRNSLFCLKTKTEQTLVGVISLDDDPEVECLPCWTASLAPSVEFARVAVSHDYQGLGIAGLLFSSAVKEAKKRGFLGAHYLVAKTNEYALRAYKSQQFSTVGECVYHGVDYFCCEKRI